jgi:hypothetical protein
VESWELAAAKSLGSSARWAYPCVALYSHPGASPPTGSCWRVEDRWISRRARHHGERVFLGHVYSSPRSITHPLNPPCAVVSTSALALVTATYKVFFEGKFENWQTWQTKRNFGRKYIVSLFKLPSRDRWLIAGSYRRLGITKHDSPRYKNLYRCRTSEVEEFADLVGRVVVGFHRSGRVSYLKPNAERWEPKLEVQE